MANESEQASAPQTKLQEQATAKGQYSYSYFASNATTTSPPAAPRKLTDEEVAAQVELEKQRSAQGVSTWNHAGTFEERDWSEWAKGRLQELCANTTFTAAEVPVTVASVTVTGHANSWLVRGKKRHGFDFEISVTWTAAVSGAEVKGTVKIPNAASDELDELSLDSLEITGGKGTPAEAAARKGVEKGLVGHFEGLLSQLLDELGSK